MSYLEVEDFVRNLKGAGASVLWVLLLSGRSLTARQLRQATGYSDKPISDALAWLEVRGIVQYNGRRHGWSLAGGFQELPGMIGQSVVSGRLPVEAADGSADGSRDYGDRSFSDLAAVQHEQDEAVGRKYSDLAAAERGAVQEWRRGDGAKGRKYSDLSLMDDLDVDDDLDLQEGSKHHQQPTRDQHHGCREGRKKSDLWRQLDGIGVHGRALRELSGLAGLEAAEVLAWYWFGRTQSWLRNPVGYVISQLREGNRPPSGFLALACVWPGLDGEERALLWSMARGVEDDRRVRAPAECGRDLRYWLGEELAELEVGALNAYLALVEAEVALGDEDVA